MKFKQLVLIFLSALAVFSLSLFLVLKLANKPLSSLLNLKPAHQPLIAQSAPVDPSTDWPQLGHDPQRTGYSPENLIPPFTLSWNVDFTDDFSSPQRLHQMVHPVVVDGRVFICYQTGSS